MTTYYVPYWPDCDGINNCGAVMDIDDFRPGAFSNGGLFWHEEEEAEDMRKATSDAPEAPGEALKHDGVWLPVGAEKPPGFSYGELRKAATVYRLAHGLGCYIREEGRDPDLGLCGQTALDNGRCAAHAETPPYYSAAKAVEEPVSYDS